MKIVFVCTGNTCRSPMLKFMFEDYLARNNIKDITVASAGTMQHEKPMSQDTVSVLDAHGIPHGENISVFCSDKVLDGSDFVFTMTRERAEFLVDLYGERYLVVPIADILGAEIPDPYGNGFAAYEQVYRLFEVALPKIYAYLRR